MVHPYADRVDSISIPPSLADTLHIARRIFACRRHHFLLSLSLFSCAMRLASCSSTYFLIIDATVLRDICTFLAISDLLNPVSHS